VSRRPGWALRRPQSAVCPEGSHVESGCLRPWRASTSAFILLCRVLLTPAFGTPAVGCPVHPPTWSKRSGAVVPSRSSRARQKRHPGELRELTPRARRCTGAGVLSIPMARGQVVRARLMRARLAASAIVLGLIVGGTTIAIAASDGSIWRELGLALLSGGVVGGALVSVESMLVSAAEARSEHEALISQITSSTDLNGIDLSGRELRAIYLPGRALVASNLAGAILDEAKLYFSDMRHADLLGASLRGADLSGSTLAFADLRGADLSESILHDVALSDARLGSADLRGAILVDGRLQRTELTETKLERTTVERTYLHGAHFEHAEIRGVVLRDNEYDDSTCWPPSSSHQSLS
jgi:uncharacterized protein YjbI with pentapeptide repeats